MLSRIVKEKIYQHRLSLRQAARQAGVSHTTIARIKDGKQVDVSTIVKIAHWLEIDYKTLLPGEDNNLQHTINSLYVLLTNNPPLATELTRMVTSLQEGRIEQNDLDEIIKYIGYKVQLSRG